MATPLTSAATSAVFLGFLVDSLISKGLSEGDDDAAVVQDVFVGQDPARVGVLAALPGANFQPFLAHLTATDMEPISAVPHRVSAVDYAVDQTCDGSVEIGFVAGFRGILVRRGGIFEQSDYLFFRQDFQVVEGEQQ